MLLLIQTALAQDVSIHESLATGSSATTIYGGTFTGAGWRLDDANSRMVWDLGTQVERGDISVTVDGISWDNLLGANNHLIELFSEGGHSSDNRAINLRLYGYGDGDPYGEWGDLKLLAWDRTTNPGGEDLVAEQRYYGLDWDGLPHTWRITWDLAELVLYRDGAELIRSDVTGMDLRVRYLWLPLQDWGGDYGAPIGATYSNLSLDAYEPAPEEDPVDTGELPDDGDASTYTPIDDVTAASWESGVYPDVEDLSVEGDGANPTAVTYLRFDLSGVSGTVRSASLRVHAHNDDSAEGDGGTAYAVGETAWSEETLVWGARPALGAAVGTYPAVHPGDVLDIDVTGGVHAGGMVTLALATTGSDGTHFSSKELSGGAEAPVLRVDVVADDSGGSTDDTAVDGGDSGTGDSGAGDSDSGGPSGDTGQGTPGDPNVEGKTNGCGCSTGAAAPGGAFGALLGLAVALRRRDARSIRRG